MTDNSSAGAYLKHKDYLLVQVPETAYSFQVLESELDFCTKDLEAEAPIGLPPGTWQLIGLASELTEEQCDCIVGGLALEHEGNRLYQPWTNEIEGHYSASENLSDLLRSHNLNANQTVVLKLIEA